MTARVIAVVNQKGGSGKTTVSMHLGGTLALRGSRVLIVDADPQGTATRWAASAEDAALFPASVVGLSAATSKVHREVKRFVNDYEWIVIDCPPAVNSPIPQSALLIADLALVPIIPSPLDMWAAVGIREVIQTIQGVNEELQARLVLNQFQPHTSLGQEATEILSEFGIPLCSTHMGNRQIYRQAAVYGQVVQQFGSKAKEATEEIERLTTEIEGIISHTV